MTLPISPGFSATISPCGQYRYRLNRPAPNGLERAPAVLFVMVNPSTADATTDDATLRKVRGFASVNRLGRVMVGNVFAKRATDVRELRNAGDPVGPENASHIWQMVAEAEIVVFAWGPLAKLPRHLRDHWRLVDDVVRMAKKRPVCLGAAQDGHPRHPLMVSYTVALTPWERPA